MSSRRRMDRWVPDERLWDRDRDRRPPHPPWDSSRDWDRHPYDPRSYRPPPPYPPMPLHPPRATRDRYPDRNFDRDVPRDLARTPPLPQTHRPRSPFSPHPSQSRSPSPSSPNHHRKHRLPARRSPIPAFSPLSRDLRPDRVRPEHWDRDQRSRNDVYWGSAAPPPGASRTGRRGGDLPHSEVEYRPVSPSPVSPRRTPPPPRSPAPPPPPSEPTEESMAEDVTQVKDDTLPTVHEAVSFALKRPNAPRDDHSPSPLPLPPAREEDIQRAREKRAAVGGAGERSGESGEGGLAVTMGKRKREPVQRSRKEEMEAYGRTFEGCGKQSDYNVTTKVGEGTFGEVHKAVQISTGRAMALKRILMHNEKEGMPVTALREIKILKAMKHPNVVDIVDMFVVRSKGKESPLSVYMVFPYMDHDLAGLLENERVKLQPSQIKLYMKQLLEGTEYMHRNHILHRDMKAANLLISNTGSLRIADFGLARAFDPSIVLPSTGGDSQAKGSKYPEGKEKRYTNCVVTRWYRPPELLLGARQYGGEVDIWGIGCVLGEMFMRRPILPGTSDIDQLEKIWQLCGTPNQHTWPNFDALPGCEGVKRFQNYPKKLRSMFVSICIVPETCDLLDKLLMCNPRDRITATQALDHDYFWTDPLPADPKTLPVYESSHEFDKRGRRNNIPPPPHGYPPPEHLRPTLQHGQAFHGPPPGHGHGHGRPGRPPPPVMLTALMQQAQGQSGGISMGGGPYPLPPATYGQLGPGVVPINGFAAPPPQGYPPPLPYGHSHVHGHGRHHPSDRGERGERGSTSKPPIHPSLPVRPAGLPPKPSVPLGTGRYERETERERERGRERGRERERGRHGGPTTGGGNTHGGNGADGGGLSGGLPYS
ncbi:kinase-like domain-containing protein [Boletus edulis BED1]|uniref:Kinase-like domain-containing protein n=1 Tax=Boletus edulis BED1 TaxID=1328754 RepID=A0AAD4BN91_BOLED|nr:kinase-like domain-containing protein [Boletus edulis BED1]